MKEWFSYAQMRSHTRHICAIYLQNKCRSFSFVLAIEIITNARQLICLMYTLLLPSAGYQSMPTLLVLLGICSVLELFLEGRLVTNQSAQLYTDGV